MCTEWRMAYTGTQGQVVLCGNTEPKALPSGNLQANLWTGKLQGQASTACI